MNRKVLVFDFWSSYGHFKKPYTTTSPLTYSIPTRTALIGIIGAILGVEKQELHKTFTRENILLAIGINSPIKKIRMSENFINTKTCKGKWFNRIADIKGRTQIKIEFLKDPCYRIYVSLDDNDLYNKLRKNIIEHSTVFTVSMGISENLANFRYVEEYEAIEVMGNKEFKEISTVIPIKYINKEDIVFDDGEYFSENIPIYINKDGAVEEYEEILYERNSKKIKLRLEKYFILDGIEENICFI